MHLSVKTEGRIRTRKKKTSPFADSRECFSAESAWWESGYESSAKSCNFAVLHRLLYLSTTLFEEKSNSFNPCPIFYCLSFLRHTRVYYWIVGVFPSTLVHLGGISFVRTKFCQKNRLGLGSDLFFFSLPVGSRHWDDMSLFQRYNKGWLQESKLRKQFAWRLILQYNVHFFVCACLFHCVSVCVCVCGRGY